MAGSAKAGARKDYLASLQAWLERHKDYPRRARVRRDQGTALLRFVIDRSGRVLEYRIERSTGHALLDREVEAMIARADPLPPIPGTFGEDRLEISVPIAFVLR